MSFGTIPTMSIVLLCVMVVVCVAMPVTAAIFTKKKLGGSAVNILVGALVFVVFAMVLESIMHYFVLNGFAKGINDNIWLYALYGGLAAGVFEETGRFLAMKSVMKKPLLKQNAVMYGIGHGGAEALLVGGLGALGNLVISILINSGQIGRILGTAEELVSEADLGQVATYWTTPSYMYGIATFERVMAFAIQICLSYLIYRAVKDNRIILFPAAICIHFLLDAVTIILADKANSFIAEGFVLAVAVVCVVFTVKFYKQEPEPEPEPEPAKEA